MNRRAWAAKLVEFAESNREQWNTLDGMQGDGDLGTTLLLAVRSFAEVLEQHESPQAWFELGGKAIRRAAPSTMGILIASSFLSAGRYLKSSGISCSLELQDWVEVQRRIVESIREKGSAEQGDKTILDALIPAVEAFSEAVSNGGGLEDALKSAAQAAKEGAEKTAHMVARTGRSSWVGERARGIMDGGAVACSQFYKFLSDTISETG